ncbi:hypothetical protein [Nonomuraea sp. NPDC050202]|uniref:hypothetical protein n=1 Tax=Nonomuraea sp. NPDC050202 TaxID=3155035 RepID=UPI0033F9FC38
MFDGVIVTEFSGSRVNKAEWVEITDDPAQVWPPGWRTATGPDDSIVLVRQEGLSGEGNGEGTVTASSISPEEPIGAAEQPSE